MPLPHWPILPYTTVHDEIIVHFRFVVRKCLVSLVHFVKKSWKSGLSCTPCDEIWFILYIFIKFVCFFAVRVCFGEIIKNRVKSRWFSDFFETKLNFGDFFTNPRFCYLCFFRVTRVNWIWVVFDVFFIVLQSVFILLQSSLYCYNHVKSLSGRLTNIYVVGVCLFVLLTTTAVIGLEKNTFLLELLIRLINSVRKLCCHKPEHDNKHHLSDLNRVLSCTGIVCGIGQCGKGIRPAPGRINCFTDFFRENLSGKWGKRR